MPRVRSRQARDGQRGAELLAVPPLLGRGEMPRAVADT